MQNSTLVPGDSFTITSNNSIPVFLPGTPSIPPKRQKLLDEHERLCEKARSIMAAKNADYSTEDDPYKNFREFGRYGILVRLSDKFQRLKNFEANGRLAVSDESVEDTILDVINYSILFLTYPKE